MIIEFKIIITAFIFLVMSLPVILHPDAKSYIKLVTVALVIFFCSLLAVLLSGLYLIWK
jgi:hypothetical protein